MPPWKSGSSPTNRGWSMVDDYDVKGNVFVNPTSVYLPSYLPFTVCYMLPIVLSVVLHVCLSLLWCSSLSSTLSLAANTTIQPLSRWLTLMAVASDYAIANFIQRGGNSEMDEGALLTVIVQKKKNKTRRGTTKGFQFLCHIMYASKGECMCAGLFFRSDVYAERFMFWLPWDRICLYALFKAKKKQKYIRLHHGIRWTIG